jgi:Icc-related predicted phosphoesterase
MRLIVFGDIHMNLGKFRKIPEVETADCLLLTGDITHFGSRTDAEKVLAQVAAINRNILAVHGNLDRQDVADYLAETGISLHAHGRLLEGVGIFGMGGSNPTPFHTPIEYSEEELQGFLAAAYEAVREADCHILLSHTPPARTRADRIRNGVHVGSIAVRRFIAEKQPELCLCGHIHEARSADVLGDTMVINPGMIRDGGWVEVCIDRGQVRASLRNC